MCNTNFQGNYRCILAKHIYFPLKFFDWRYYILFLCIHHICILQKDYQNVLLHCRSNHFCGFLNLVFVEWWLSGEKKCKTNLIYVNMCIYQCKCISLLLINIEHSLWWFLMYTCICTSKNQVRNMNIFIQPLWCLCVIDFAIWFWLSVLNFFFWLFFYRGFKA